MKDLPYPYLKNIIDVHHLFLPKLLKLKISHNLPYTIVGGFFEFKKPLVLVLSNILELTNQ